MQKSSLKCYNNLTQQRIVVNIFVLDRVRNLELLKNRLKIELRDVVYDHEEKLKEKDEDILKVHRLISITSVINCIK